MNIQYLSIPQSYADRIRNTMKDDFGNKVELSVAGETGYGPCRCCLKQFQPGEKRLLFTYAPVNADNPYNETGPVYIHENCSSYADPDVFPPEVKQGRLPIHLVLRSYNNDRRMIDARFVKNNDEVEMTIETLLSNGDIAFIHIRNATYQCFIAEARLQGTGS